MAETLTITPNATKDDLYKELIPQIESVIKDEDDLIANLANIAAILHTAFSPLWTGFYIRKEDELVLGPFQGPLACTRIPLKPIARGVCGGAADSKETLVVPNVDEFPGHIACSSLSKSEIVVPLVAYGETQLVLDIDSTNLNEFDIIDKNHLESLMNTIKNKHF